MGYEVEYNGEITISPPLLGDIADPRKSIIPMLRKMKRELDCHLLEMRKAMLRE